METNMKFRIYTTLALLVSAVSAYAADGMVNVASNFDVTETADRMESLLQQKGMTVFNRIDHSENAAVAGMELRGTVLLIFGNPKIGSRLMQCSQSVAIDLPQKALAWEDDEGDVWLSYNDPSYLSARHQLSACDEVITKVGQALSGISRAAAAE
jgi:uncharacterized protein (DUF302 family)